MVSQGIIFLNAVEAKVGWYYQNSNSRLLLKQ